MHNYFALDLTSSDLIAVLNNTFELQKIDALASIKPFGIQDTQYIACPIEVPSQLVRVYFRLPAEENSPLDPLQQVLLNESFLRHLINTLQAPSFDLELLVTACASIGIQKAYARAARRPTVVMNSARDASQRFGWLETVAGIPDLGEVLNGYADDLLAHGLR